MMSKMRARKLSGLVKLLNESVVMQLLHLGVMKAIMGNYLIMKMLNQGTGYTKSRTPLVTAFA